MYKRKLIALDYQNPNGFNIKDESEFRNFIVWLEDQKIRHYKIEDRAALRKISAGNWEDALKQYIADLGCPFSSTNRPALVDWILGHAIRLEYGDNVDKYRAAASGILSPSSKPATSNPLDNMDFNHPDFKKGVAELATLLQIPPHPDHQQQMKAICIFVRQRLSKEVIERQQKEGVKAQPSIPLDKIDLGFETSDYISQEAAKILRILFIKELRELQDSANQAIVAVQSLTANPKTDTKLGKVGR